MTLEDDLYPPMTPIECDTCGRRLELFVTREETVIARCIKGHTEIDLLQFTELDGVSRRSR